jgi:hypothetical protein
MRKGFLKDIQTANKYPISGDLQYSPASEKSVQMSLWFSISYTNVKINNK